MSRVFTGSGADFLSAAADVSSSRANYTFLAWVKPDVAITNGTQYVMAVDVAGGTNPNIRMGGAADPAFAVFSGVAGTVTDFDNRLSKAAWHSIIGRVNGDDLTLEIDGFVYTNSATNSPIVDTMNSLFVGVSAFGIDAFGGKIAHVAAWTRALSDVELDDLHAGTNPGTISSANQWFYYPLTDAGLTNVWTPGGGDSAGTLSVTGTVTSDTGDNPTVTGGGPPGSLIRRDRRMGGGFGPLLTGGMAA